MTDEITLSECTRSNTCYDCTNEACWHHGKKEADCPKYHCDNAVPLDCEHCGFIDHFIEDMRQVYGSTRNNNNMRWNAD